MKLKATDEILKLTATLIVTHNDETSQCTIDIAPAIYVLPLSYSFEILKNNRDQDPNLLCAFAKMKTLYPEIQELHEILDKINEIVPSGEGNYRIELPAETFRLWFLSQIAPCLTNETPETPKEEELTIYWEWHPKQYLANKIWEETLTIILPTNKIFSLTQIPENVKSIDNPWVIQEIAKKTEELGINLDAEEITRQLQEDSTTVYHSRQLEQVMQGRNMFRNEEV